MNEVETRLASVMFRSLPQLSQYRRPTEGGFHSVVFSVGGAPPVFADLQVSIRLDMVEQLVHQFTTGLSSYGPNSTTLLVSASRLRGAHFQRSILERPTDVPRVAQAWTSTSSWLAICTTSR